MYPALTICWKCPPTKSCRSTLHSAGSALLCSQVCLIFRNAWQLPYEKSVQCTDCCHLSLRCFEQVASDVGLSQKKQKTHILKGYRPCRRPQQYGGAGQRSSDACFSISSQMVCRADLVWAPLNPLKAWRVERYWRWATHAKQQSPCRIQAQWVAVWSAEPIAFRHL